MGDGLDSGGAVVVDGKVVGGDGPRDDGLRVGHRLAHEGRAQSVALGFERVGAGDGGRDSAVRAFGTP
ncbi:MAG: hypothetical protein GX856_08715 [Gammaproteobacteria bacterium]|nr:hypothetical protein [Gammaproteobacteria bacterium]